MQDSASHGSRLRMNCSKGQGECGHRSAFYSGDQPRSAALANMRYFIVQEGHLRDCISISDFGLGPVLNRSLSAIECANPVEQEQPFALCRDHLSVFVFIMHRLCKVAVQLLMPLEMCISRAAHRQYHPPLAPERGDSVCRQ